MTPDYGLVAAYGAGEVVKFNLKSSRKQWVRRLDGCAGPRLCEVLEDGRIVLVFSEHALLLRHVSWPRRVLALRLDALDPLS